MNSYSHEALHSLKSWLVHEASSALVTLCQRCCQYTYPKRFAYPEDSLQSAITQAQPQALLMAWASGPACDLPILLQNKCLIFIWKIQTHNLPTFYNSLRFYGKSAEEKKKHKTPFRSTLHSANEKPIREQMHCNVDMVQWSQCYALFPLFLTGKQWYLKEAYLSPCSRIASFALYSY